jgi:hypothetical protein
VSDEGKYQLVGDAGKVRARRGASHERYQQRAHRTLWRRVRLRATALPSFAALTPLRAPRAAAAAPQKNGEKKLRRHAPPAALRAPCARRR